MNRFRQLALLGVLVAALGAAAPGPPPAALDPALRVLLSGSSADDAGIVRAARDGRLASFPRGLLPIAAPPGAAAPPDDGRLEVFLETTGGAPSGDGVEAIRMGERLYAARVTAAGLRRLVEANAVASARLARPVWPALDRSGPYLGLPQIRRVSAETGAITGATGRGVLLGTVDSGVDWSHPDFRDSENYTRLYRYWDQGRPFGRPPAGYPFGVEYDAFEIEHGLLDVNDVSGHGTHVLGIAAGNGRASFHRGHGVQYAGIAPEATLVAVRTNFTEYGVALGVRYIFEQAEALGFPAVVNLSLGNHFGPHLGNTPFERTLNALAGPGRLLVAAAGNDGQHDVHAEIHPAGGAVSLVRFDFPDYVKGSGTFNFVALEGWFAPEERFRVSAIDPDGNMLGPIDWGDEDAQFTSLRGILRGWNTGDQGRGTFYVEIEDNPASARRAVGTWTLRVDAVETGDAPEIDCWIVNWQTAPDTAPRFLDAVDDEETVLVPATASGVLAVGAIVTRACWNDASGQETCYPTMPTVGNVAAFTSYGPTSDGRPKPDIYAPGAGIVSARSSAISGAIWTAEEIQEYTSPDGRYWTSQGTSMAAPHATGTVALLLERFPALTHEQMSGRLAERSMPGVDQRTGAPIRILAAGASVAPIVDLALSEANIQRDGIHVSWYVGKERGEAAYRVYKAYADDGPYEALSVLAIRGNNPFTLVDVDAEPGRSLVYRVAVRDAMGLEEDLDTLRVSTPGVPQFALRAPDPNPAREFTRVRFYLPASPAGGAYRLEAFDVQGRRVRDFGRTLFGGAGEERLQIWDLTTDDGRRVGPGVYFLRMELEYERPMAGGGALPPGPRTIVRRVVALP